MANNACSRMTRIKIVLQSYSLIRKTNVLALTWIVVINVARVQNWQNAVICPNRILYGASSMRQVSNDLHGESLHV